MDDNWKLIVEEMYDKIGMVYEDTATGELYRMFGLVHGESDYYYGLYGIDGEGLALISCVGSLENCGYKLLDDYIETVCPYCSNESLTLVEYGDNFGPNNVRVEGLEHYVCSKCPNCYETPRQFRYRMDKISDAYKG